MKIRTLLAAAVASAAFAAGAGSASAAGVGVTPSQFQTSNTIVQKAGYYDDDRFHEQRRWWRWRHADNGPRWWWWRHRHERFDDRRDRWSDNDGWRDHGDRGWRRD